MDIFNYKDAQAFELQYHIQMMEIHFKKLYDEWMENEEIQKDSIDPFILSRMWENNFFDIRKDEDLKSMKDFINHIKDKSSLDVGCGWSPYTKYACKVKERYMIDPLINEFKKHEESLFGTSFFVGVKIYAKNAEELIPELINVIDGYIFCRNTIDHSDDPIGILNTISQYATSGCYFLFWSDIWRGLIRDVGHRNITRSHSEMDKIFKGLGFRKIISMENNRIRSGENDIEYGGVFIKE